VDKNLPLQAKFYTAQVFLKIPMGRGKNFFKIYRYLGMPTQKGLPALIYAILEIFTFIARALNNV
jgi:hypothetical protein